MGKVIGHEGVNAIREHGTATVHIEVTYMTGQDGCAVEALEEAYEAARARIAYGAVHQPAYLPPADGIETR